MIKKNNIFPVTWQENSHFPGLILSETGWNAAIWGLTQVSFNPVIGDVYALSLVQWQGFARDTLLLSHIASESKCSEPVVLSVLIFTAFCRQ